MPNSTRYIFVGFMVAKAGKADCDALVKFNSGDNAFNIRALKSTDGLILPKNTWVAEGRSVVFGVVMR
jgi:hypothetical protein